MDDSNTNKQFRLYDESGKYIRLSVDETIARELNKWKDWKCSAGIRGLYIDYDGNLWKCNTASAKYPRFNFDGWDEVLKKNEPAVITNDWWPIREKLAIEYRKTPNAYQKTIPIDKKLPGLLGNIYDGYELPKDWFVCPWTSCSCGADVILSKSKTDNEKTLLSVTNKEFIGRDETRNNISESISTPVAVEMNFPIRYQILWDLGRRCNYDCSYCWTYVHNRTDPHKDFDVLLNTTNKLINEWSKKDTIRWNFGGGEPTLHPQFIKLLKHLKDNNQWTMVTSNGSRDYRYWQEAVKYLNSINLSAHFDGLLGEKEEDRFVKNIEIICEYFDKHNDDHWLEIKLMAPTKYIERALNLKKKIDGLGTLNKHGANNRIKGVLSLVPIRSMGDSGELVEYTEEQLEIFRNQ